MQITYKDQTFSFENSKVTMEQAYVIKAETGLGIVSWLQSAMEAGDPDSLRCFYWALLAQNGTILPVTDPSLKEIEPLVFLEALGRAAAEEESAAPLDAPAVPTAAPTPTSGS